MALSKIVLYIDTMCYGGAQRVMANLTEYFIKRGIDVVLVNDFKLPTETKQYIVNEKVKRYYLRDSLYGNLVIKNFERMYALRRIIKNEMPDIVLSFLGRPNKRMLLSTIGLKTKKIVSVRNDPYREYGSTKTKKMIAGLLFLLADGYVFQTTDAMEYFNKSVMRKATIILNPVADSFFEVERKKEIHDIITVGRLSKQKNQRMLIDAYAQLVNTFPDEKLIIYGRGELQQELDSRICELNLKGKVVLAGESSNIPEVLSSAKLFVLSSDYEGMPNALMEALTVGVPCIAADCPCGGPRELIENNVNGLIFPCGDVESLVIAMKKVLQSSEYADSLSKKAQESAQKYKEGIVCTNWLEYLQSKL